MAERESKPAKVAIDSDRIGFFGKIPSHGDFLSEGVDRDVIVALDEWLRSGMHACSEAFGERWSRVFSSSPPRRFIVEPGIWSGSSHAGILLPSKDRVGRNFPLVILAQLQRFRQHPRTLYLDKTWFMAAEALGETSFNPDFDMTRFTNAIRQLRMPKPHDVDDEDLYRRQGQPTSLWWHIDPETRRVRGLKFDGKPKIDDFVRLFREALIPAGEESKQAGRPNPVRVRPSSDKKSYDQEQASTSVEIAASAIVYSYATHPGTRISTNTQSLFVSNAPSLFAVADGLGQTSGSLEAARLVTNILAEIADEPDADILTQAIKGKLGTVNSLLLSRPVSEVGSRARSSIVTAAVTGDRLTIVWSGDARAYILRDGTMHLLSRDHVTVGLKKQLSQCVGMSQQFRPETRSEDWKPQDRLLLCSYSLVQVLKERNIADVLRETAIAGCANALIQEALIERANGSVSAIVIGHDDTQ